MNRRKIAIATNNEDKVREIERALLGIPYEVISLKSIGMELHVDESGNTFAENAMIKAKDLYERIGGYVLADDSGLCIDRLGGAPGIYSSRFFGAHSTYKEKFSELNRLLADVPLPLRTASFVCSMVLLRDDSDAIVVEEKLSGIILNVEFGDNGFGYDPIFYVPEKGRTVAQLSDAEKNQISHRGKAIRSVLEKLRVS